MVLPRWLATVNRRYTNRILGSIPRRRSPFVELHHVGRRSGRAYLVLVAAFPAGDGFVLTPTYGPEADWVRNVLDAGSFSIDRRGEAIVLGDARLVGRSEAWPNLPRIIRVAMWVMRVDWYVRADRVGT